jgi:sugar lactone lactonase YvrE
MGFGNSPPVVTSVAVSPSPVPGSAQATITCSATDDKGVVQLTFTVSGGALAGAASQTVVLAAPQTATTQSVTWTTPAPGTYSVTCAATDGGGFWSGPVTTSSTVSVAVVPVADPPLVSGITASATTVFPGATVQLAASASGTGLTYAWSASAGAVTPADASATWTAPATAGPATVTLTVTDAQGRTASGTIGLGVIWASAGAAWSPAAGTLGFFPTRLALDAAGFAYVSDIRAGEVTYLSPRGDVLKRFAVGGEPAGVAVAPSGELLVADAQAGRVDRYDVRGRRLGALGQGTGELVKPLALAVDRTTGRVYVLDAGAGVVKVYDQGGAAAGAIAVGGVSAAGLAVDGATHRLYVTDSSRGQVLVFDEGGAPLATLGSYGAPLIRPAGVAVGADGNLYVVDSYQALVVVLAPTGATLATLGTYGSGAGQLEIPLDVALDPRGQVLVTNTQLARIETFQLPSFAGVTCPGDSDCDGMPDWWELAHHLNPLDPTDARLDPDHDGLTNLDEYRSGTDPWNWDTDGDGASDGEEVAEGMNPLDPTDHRPVLVASGPSATAPGLVRVSASLQSAAPCTLSWTQLAGPPVTLRGADTMTPSFVARAAARYRVQGVATCGTVRTAPAVVETAVQNVAPRPDAGRILVVHAGRPLSLDGGFSSDANGDAFALSWGQTLGVPLVGPVAGADLDTRARVPGLLEFELTATDAAAAQASATVPVLVVDEGSPAPTAVADTPVAGRVGAPIGLLAQALGPDEDARLLWTQVEGPAAVDLEGPAPSFVPRRAGHYAFDVAAVKGRFRSPAARVDVFVSDGPPLPAAVARAPLTATVGDALALDGAGSSPGGGGALAYAWSIVSGPAGGLTDASQAAATLVPFAPGSYVVQLQVKEGEAVGIPARVRIDVHESGRALPVAIAGGPGVVAAGAPVRLTGAASRSPAAAPLRYRWTQISGPWVALDDVGAADTTFHAVEPGVYVFELEVFDGHARSAPAAVAVLVTPPASAQGSASR